MTVDEIREKLINHVAAIKSRDISAVMPEVPFHQLGIDSLGFVEILVFIEKNFNLPLIDSGLDKQDFGSINSLASFIHKKL